MPLFFMAITLNLKGDSQDPADLVEIPEWHTIAAEAEQAAMQEEPADKPKAAASKSRK
jgi:hypothetical protein